MWRGVWTPSSSWKLHPTVGSTSPNSFKRAWDKNRDYFLKIGCFLFLVFLGLLCMVFLSVWFGYCPHEKCQFSPVGEPRASESKAYLFKAPCGSILLALSLAPSTLGSTSPNSFKHAWDKNRAYFLKIGCLFVFGVFGASVWRGEWTPCSSWKPHPTVGSTSPISFKHAWDKNRAYFLKIGCFLFLLFLGLLCGVVSGSPVAPGSYTQQWPPQAPIPSRMLEIKIGPIS